jgi:hypothetical protein
MVAVVSRIADIWRVSNFDWENTRTHDRPRCPGDRNPQIGRCNQKLSPTSPQDMTYFDAKLSLVHSGAEKEPDILHPILAALSDALLVGSCTSWEYDTRTSRSL